MIYKLITTWVKDNFSQKKEGEKEGEFWFMNFGFHTSE